MKKLILILVCFLSAGSLFGGTFVSVGTGLGFGSQNYESASVNSAVFAVNFNSFFGDRFGLLTDINLLFPLSSYQNDVPVPFEVYETRWGLEGIGGVGLLINMSSESKLIVGAGLHISSLYLSPEAGSGFSALNYLCLGPGIHASFVQQIAGELVFRAGLSFGSDLLSLSASSGLTEYSHGVRILPSVGIGAAF